MTPDNEAIVGFWRDLWSKTVVHNRSAEWLANQQADMLNSVHPQEGFQITLDKLVKQLQRVKNWKAPGHDAIHGYWLRSLTSIHSRFAGQLQETFWEGPSEWMTRGRTVLVMKDVNRGMTPSNFRPIICLPTIWKL